jgi:hypothetical protein
MTRNGDDRGGGPLVSDRREPRWAEDAGFDRWLEDQLHKAFDPVLGEGLPKDLQELLKRFEPRERPGGESGTAGTPESPGRSRNRVDDANEGSD